VALVVVLVLLRVVTEFQVVAVAEQPHQEEMLVQGAMV
jgi:hypothetical protein